MLVFYANFGGGERGLQAAPLLVLLPLLLNSGILQLLFGSSVSIPPSYDLLRVHGYFYRRNKPNIPLTPLRAVDK